MFYNDLLKFLSILNTAQTSETNSKIISIYNSRACKFSTKPQNQKLPKDISNVFVLSKIERPQLDPYELRTILVIFTPSIKLKSTREPV